MKTDINKVGKYYIRQHFRNWMKVSADELRAVKVCQLSDEKGLFYISDTSFYVPQWLREGYAGIDDIDDEKIIFTVERNSAATES